MSGFIKSGTYMHEGITFLQLASEKGHTGMACTDRLQADLVILILLCEGPAEGCLQRGQALRIQGPKGGLGADIR